MKNVGIVYNKPQVSGEFAKSSTDILVQVEAIEKSLIELSYKPVRIEFTRNIQEFLNKIKNIEVIFNLCETVDENPHLSWHPAAVIELLNINFTGSPSQAIMMTTDKLLTKRLLKSCAIKTPDYILYDLRTDLTDFNVLKYPVILKPRFEDASIGIDQESVCKDEIDLKNNLRDFYNRFGSIIIEEYIEGREFNVSLIGYPDFELLPPAEIDFSSFPDSLYRIVGYRAKWDESSFEYNHTPRKFLQNLSQDFISKIKKISYDCSTLFILRDYARIDLRINKSGEIYVLEINANPCLSPDAGFFAAVEKTQINYTQMVEKILSYACNRINH